MTAAAKATCDNIQYLRRLLRAGKLDGIKIGQIWIIDGRYIFSTRIKKIDLHLELNAILCISGGENCEFIKEIGV